jgi:nitroimidazol reductase NimA-like FMN-containing flavoprotein (pyridoxamine 5'-phosphate oxidase superfamily)
MKQAIVIAAALLALVLCGCGGEQPEVVKNQIAGMENELAEIKALVGDLKSELSICKDGLQEQDASWENGGPKYIYVKPIKKSPFHMPYDETLSCLDCHKWDGVDAYTSATMALKKSKKGRLPQPAIKQAVLETLKGTGDYREMYTIATAFNNEPVATCMEFTLDPETLTLVASSEKQTEKLFHIAANPRVSMVYVKHRDDYRYFVNPVGVQIKGRAVQLKYGDPGFNEAATLCLDSAMNHMPEEMKAKMSREAMLESINKNQLITKIIPERIVITSGDFIRQGLHRKQIWEVEK